MGRTRTSGKHPMVITSKQRPGIHTPKQQKLEAYLDAIYLFNLERDRDYSDMRSARGE